MGAAGSLIVMLGGLCEPFFPKPGVLCSPQSHPLSLCNTSEDERQEKVFISIVKLESPERNVPQCLPLLDKVRAHQVM